MNQVWRTLDLGHVRLLVDKDGVGIEHGRSAERGRSENAEWDTAEPVILEGVYIGWFRSLGGDRLSLKRVAMNSGVGSSIRRAGSSIRATAGSATARARAMA